MQALQLKVKLIYYQKIGYLILNKKIEFSVQSVIPIYRGMEFTPGWIPSTPTAFCTEVSEPAPFAL
jgi:hypothetical protein